MSTFVLVPGAGGNASYWRELVAELERRGHEAIAVDIPQDDPAVGLPEYAALVEAAIGERARHRPGGPVAGRLHRADGRPPPVRMIVLLNAMIPLPGETPGQWWGATGSDPARRAAEEAAGRDPEFDEERTFFHDLPDDVRAQMERDPQPRAPADTIWNQPCDFERWPDVPIRVVVGRDDRLFPWEFQQRVVARAARHRARPAAGRPRPGEEPARRAGRPARGVRRLRLRPQAGSRRRSVAGVYRRAMLETPEELARLQSLLDASHARATDHLRGIIHDDRTLSAAQVAALLPGMKVISVATVTAHGEPRISAMDGHFLHGTWTFSTSRTAAKARHLAAPAGRLGRPRRRRAARGVQPRPGRRAGGRRARRGRPALDRPLRLVAAVVGRRGMYRLDPSWMVGYAWKRDELLAERGVDGLTRSSGTSRDRTGLQPYVSRLFEPLTLRGTTFRNRVWVSPDVPVLLGRRPADRLAPGAPRLASPAAAPAW